MTTVELERIARSVIPPVGATMAIARVDDQGRHCAAFLIDGRIHGVPVGPAFDRPRDAIRLVDLLNGEAPRPRLDDSAGLPGDGLTSGDDRAEHGAPAVTAGASLVGRCVVCGRDLPPGSRSQRRTCSDACRVALLRSQRAPSSVRADVDAAVTVSVGLRASDAADTSPPSQEPLGL